MPLRASRFEHQGEKFIVVSVATAPRDEDFPKTLAPAEREVMSLVLQGLSNAAIARRRSTSARTVANQIASIFRKLGVGSRNELAIRFR